MEQTLHKRRLHRPKIVSARFQRKAFLIPSSITILGMFCGLLAVILSMRGNIHNACLYIIIASVLDGLDGRVARKLNATSDFGREFDSLSDLLAFCVAPAVLAYSWAFSATFDEFGILVAFFFVACGATRLARFNITTSAEGTSTFCGLPTPGAALAITAIAYLSPQPIVHMGPAALVAVYLFALGALMVSTLPFMSIKKVNLSFKNPTLVFLALATLIAFAWYQNKKFLLVGTLLYVLSGPILYTRRKLRQTETLRQAPTQEVLQ